MATDVLMPKLGLTMTEGTVTSWQVREGEQVSAEQTVGVIETDKVSHEVTAKAGGILHVLAKEGDTVPVGQVIGIIAASQAEYDTIAGKNGAEDSVDKAVVPSAASARAAERARISPLARKLAEEYGIDISQVSASDPGGRIVREDVLRAVQERERAADAGEVKAEAKIVAPEPAADAELRRVGQVIPLKGMRRVIAERLHSSLRESAQMTRFGEVDMTELKALRRNLLAQEQALGARITYTPLFVMIAAKALRQHPIVNSSLVGDEIRVWRSINIGVAVNVEGEATGGLVVPVLRDADGKTLIEIHTELQALIEKARAHKLMPDDVSGGTFTITNQGAFAPNAAEFDTPIINPPEAAILGTYGIVDKPVVRNGEITIRPIMSITLTHDHRVIDGALASAFMGTVRRIMETPSLLLC